jgi:hypothetical protein
LTGEHARIGREDEIRGFLANENRANHNDKPSYPTRKGSQNTEDSIAQT